MTANLLSRLEGLTWPDREVDGLVEIRFGLMPEDAVFARENVFGQEVNQWHTGGFGSYQFHYPEEYTASLDAVVALCERVLPVKGALLEKVILAHLAQTFPGHEPVHKARKPHSHPIPHVRPSAHCESPLCSKLSMQKTTVSPGLMAPPAWT